MKLVHMAWCNSSFPNHRDFIAIGLHLGGRFGKSKGLWTEAAKRLQISPELEITRSGLGPAYSIYWDLCCLKILSEYHVAAQVL